MHEQKELQPRQNLAPLVLHVTSVQMQGGQRHQHVQRQREVVAADVEEMRVGRSLEARRELDGESQEDVEEYGHPAHAGHRHCSRDPHFRRVAPRVCVQRPVERRNTGRAAGGPKVDL